MEWEGGFDLKSKDGGHEAVGDRAGGEEASEDGRGVSRGPWRRWTSGDPISSMRLDHEEKDRRGFLREIDNKLRRKFNNKIDPAS